MQENGIASFDDLGVILIEKLSHGKDESSVEKNWYDKYL